MTISQKEKVTCQFLKKICQHQMYKLYQILHALGQNDIYEKTDT